MLEELNRAAADIKAAAASLKLKVEAFFGSDHDAAADLHGQVDALTSAVDDHLAAAAELEGANTGVNPALGGNPPQPQDVADHGVKSAAEGAGTEGGPDGEPKTDEEIDPDTGKPKVQAGEDDAPQYALNADGKWTDAEGNVLDPQPEIDPATGKPVGAAV